MMHAAVLIPLMLILGLISLISSIFVLFENFNFFFLSLFNH